jgi:hypothetical protein
MTLELMTVGLMPAFEQPAPELEAGCLARKKCSVRK